MQSQAGVQLDAEKHVTSSLSVFGQGWLGTNWARDTGYDLDYGAIGGLRWTF